MPEKSAAGERRMRRNNIGAVVVICLFYLGLEAAGITCPILFLTGISCAGCGMSRAWMALLRLDVAAAFRFHPLFWVPVPAGIALLFWKRIPKPARKALLIAVCVLFIGTYIARLLSPEDEIVVFQVENGLLYRAFSALTGGSV